MLFIDALKEKYHLDDQGKPIIDDKENKEIEIKKSGIFTGQKSSMTYQKNNIKHQASHSLGLNKNHKSISNLTYLNDSTLYKLIDVCSLYENSNSKESVVYRRNVIGLNGAKNSAVPHSAMAKATSKNIPNNPRNGVVPNELNTKWGADNLRKKIRLIYKNFQK